MQRQRLEARPWSGGLVFTGYFTTEEEAWEALHKLEEDLTIEGGFSNVRGGIKLMEKPLCECESRDDCDESAGCVFGSFRAEDNSEPGSGLPK